MDISSFSQIILSATKSAGSKVSFIVCCLCLGPAFYRAAGFGLGALWLLDIPDVFGGWGGVILMDTA